MSDNEVERLRAELAGMRDLFEAANTVAGTRTDERDALKAAIERAREEAARWRDDLKDNSETWAVNVKLTCELFLAALAVPESNEDARCPTPCDDDCDAGCHEHHNVIWQRTHQPEGCPAVTPETTPDAPTGGED